jgi:hypothetical protein
MQPRKPVTQKLEATRSVLEMCALCRRIFQRNRQTGKCIALWKAKACDNSECPRR